MVEEQSKEWELECHKCGKTYKKHLKASESEFLFENYDPTDYECDECIQAELTAEQIAFEQYEKEHNIS